MAYSATVSRSDRSTNGPRLTSQVTPTVRAASYHIQLQCHGDPINALHPYPVFSRPLDVFDTILFDRPLQPYDLHSGDLVQVEFSLREMHVSGGTEAMLLASRLQVLLLIACWSDLHVRRAKKALV